MATRMSFLLSACLVTVYCFTYVMSACNVPSRFWCDSKEIATECGVYHQCEEYEWSRYSDAAPVDVTLYYESLCPDCKNFWTKMLYPTYLKFGPSNTIMNLTLVPYGNAHWKKSGDHYVFDCQHGADECLGNIIETCAIAIVKDIKVYLPFIHCMEASKGEIKSAAEKCSKSFPVPLDQIMNCSTSKQGNDLEHEMAVKTDSLNPPHRYVPYVTINGVHTEALENAAEKDLVKLVCDTYKGTKPSACQKMDENIFKKCIRV